MVERPGCACSCHLQRFFFFFCSFIICIPVKGGNPVPHVLYSVIFGLTKHRASKKCCVASDCECTLLLHCCCRYSLVASRVLVTFVFVLRPAGGDVTPLVFVSPLQGAKSFCNPFQGRCSCILVTRPLCPRRGGKAVALERSSLELCRFVLRSRELSQGRDERIV